MGRSGGGHHRSGRSHSHSHRRIRHTRNRHYGSSGSKGNLSSMIGVVVVFFIIVFSVMAFAIYNDVKDSDTLGSPELSPGEQYLWCGDKKIQLKYTSTKIKVYQSLYGTPDMSDYTRNISASMSGHLHKSYKYHSFFLPPGSYLSGQKSTTDATFIVIKGWEDMQNFMDDDHYGWIYRSSEDNFKLYFTEFDEYFVVVDSKSSTSFTANIYATIALYDTSNLTEECTSYSTKCDLNEDNDPNFCVVIDFDAEDFYHSVEVKIYGGDGVELKTDTIIIVSVCSIFIICVIIFTIRAVKRAMKNSSEQSAGSSTGDGPSIEFEEEEVDVEITQPEKEEETYSNTSGYPVSSPSDIPTAIITGSTETNNYPSMYNPNDANQYPTAPPPPYTTY